MIYAYNVPYHIPLEEYEGLMASREYWDDLGAEWNWSSIEQKLVRLAGFVKQGGSLKKVLNRYTKGREEEYTNRIQFCILKYILKLMVGERLKPYEKVPLVDRIKRLNKDELVELLTKELKRDVMPSSEMDKNHKFHEHWRLLSDDEWLSDEYLDKIEYRHWHKHPEEPFSQYLRRSEWWWDYRHFLFRINNKKYYFLNLQKVFLFDFLNK